jgi:two-component system NarL family sensor kinase
MEPTEDQIYVIIFATIFLGGIMSTFVISMVFIHRQRQKQNRQKIDHVKSEYEKILLNIENEIQQETLTQVGRELHDNIGQLLSLAKLNFGSIKPEKHLAGRELLSQIIQEVRGLSKTLNMDWVESITLEEDEKLVLIRVIQEILNNAIKHAYPDRIMIRTLNSGTKPQIIIEDNGIGFDTRQQSNGSGMTNLAKRMITIGGEFYIESEPGKGTLTKLTLA